MTVFSLHLAGINSQFDSVLAEFQFSRENPDISFFFENLLKKSRFFVLILQFSAKFEHAELKFIKKAIHPAEIDFHPFISLEMHHIDSHKNFRYPSC